MALCPHSLYAIADSQVGLAAWMLDYTTDLIDRMMHKYSTHDNPYALFAAAAPQFAWSIGLVLAFRNAHR
jgi:hypothetical protein